MKSVLIIAYYFPPVPDYWNGIVIRTAKVVKYFRREGLEITVLTADNSQDSNDSFMEEVAEAKTVVVSDPWNKILVQPRKSRNPAIFIKKIIGYISGRLTSLLIPDRFVGWGILSFVKVSRDSVMNNIDVIYTTSPPHTPMILAYLLSRKFRLPLVLDYRDPWTGNPYYEGKWGIKKYINGILEKKILNHAKLIVCATESHSKEIGSRYQIFDKVITLPNGFDPEDIANISDKTSSTSSICHFVYSGGFGGSRTSRFFFDALRQLDKNVARKIKITILGFISEKEMSYLDSAKQSSIDVIWLRGIPHRQALEVIKTADVCLVFIYPEEHSAQAIPGKVYEYMALNKAVAAVAPSDSELSYLIQQYHLGFVIDPYNIESIKKSVEAIIEQKETGILDHWAYHDESQLLDKYDRKKNALKLYQLIRSL